VPDEFIAYIGSMVGRPIEYYSCFISYSTHDQEFAKQLHADLQTKGVRCWFAPHDIHDRLLLILSEDSMSSEWVKTEIAKARKRDVKEGQRCCFLSGWWGSRGCAIGSASTAIRGKTRRARCGSISSPTSATGRNTIHIRRRWGGWWGI
jgi:TIR domain-containing protein